MFHNAKKHVTAHSFVLKFVTIFVAAMVFAGCAFVFAACNKQTEAQLLFSDEFDGTQLDETKWYASGTDLDDGIIRRGGRWTEDSVLVEGGNLIIRTTYGEDKVFRTGAVNAQKLMTYGYYEAKCKLPEAYGLWSAFWIMCDKMHIEEPDATIGGAEIDIFESPFFSSSCVQHAIHTAGYGAMHREQSMPFLEVKSPNEGEHGYRAWHTFALDWQPDSYKFYIDGKLSWQTYAPYGIIGNPNYIEKNISSVPSYIILSVEVGGTNGEPANSPFITGGNPIRDNQLLFDMNNFSVDFLVDYVRVWDKNPHV